MPGIIRPPTLTFIRLGFPGVVETAHAGFIGPNFVAGGEVPGSFGISLLSVEVESLFFVQLEKVSAKKRVRTRKENEILKNIFSLLPFRFGYELKLRVRQAKLVVSYR